jgi:hypothetical protein
MRWIRIRAANIDPQLRESFERYGTGGMIMALGDMNSFLHQGRLTKATTVLAPLLNWLTEQYDRAERKETWNITMEAAITVFVAAELILSLLDRICH